MLPGTILQRCHAIRMGQKALAAMAGLSQKSVGMTLREQSSPRFSNLQLMEAALLKEELRLRDHLLALHPVTGTEQEKVA